MKQKVYTVCNATFCSPRGNSTGTGNTMATPAALIGHEENLQILAHRCVSSAFLCTIIAYALFCINILILFVVFKPFPQSY